MLDFEQRLYDVADGEELIVYPYDCIKSLLDNELVDIFTQKGVPRFWTPDVDFIHAERGGFNKLSDFADLNDNSNLLNESFTKCKDYSVFAMHNNSFIAINKEKQIVMVDYENYTEVYVHQDMKTFLYGLIIFNELVLRIIDKFPECDYYGDYLEKEDIDNFKSEILKMDERAIGEKTFWSIALGELEL